MVVVCGLEIVSKKREPIAFEISHNRLGQEFVEVVVIDLGALPLSHGTVAHSLEQLLEGVLSHEIRILQHICVFFEQSGISLSVAMCS